MDACTPVSPVRYQSYHLDYLQCRRKLMRPVSVQGRIPSHTKPGNNGRSILVSTRSAFISPQRGVPSNALASTVASTTIEIPPEVLGTKVRYYWASALTMVKRTVGRVPARAGAAILVIGRLRLPQDLVYTPPRDDSVYMALGSAECSGMARKGGRDSLHPRLTTLLQARGAKKNVKHPMAVAASSGISAEKRLRRTPSDVQCVDMGAAQFPRAC